MLQTNHLKYWHGLGLNEKEFFYKEDKKTAGTYYKCYN